jgi:hypothetical protein
MNPVYSLAHYLRPILILSLVGKLEGKRPLGRSRRRWEENIRMDVRKIVWV